jgi:hypothetical protein
MQGDARYDVLAYAVLACSWLLVVAVAHRRPPCPRCAPSPDQGRKRCAEAGRNTAVDLHLCAWWS